MPKKKLDFDTVRTIARDLPGAEESTTYGTPCFKARGNMFTYVAIHRSAEPNTLGVLVDIESRAAMIADDPNVYYLTDHYVNYPFVLVRLNQIQPAALKDLLTAAWRLATAKANKRPIRKSPMRKSPGRVRTPRKKT
jgi:hypothetical protein